MCMQAKLGRNSVGKTTQDFSDGKSACVYGALDLLLSSFHAHLQYISKASPILWNSLPQSVRLSHNMFAFRRSLKTLLFREAYSAFT
ncbi:hypothetical protein AB205_0022580 [Aquarana catesbeiana]|uniref:Uncharacterized protein n=1 Tax=Aquarana catesbeiana TaxID=8400 RepID=A0A2G9S366_AQUCT|nr:hypothetical protein AB205_0022580 [Aquarana catesbeiana]